MVNRKLFPKGESWASGDEALDLKLNQKLENVISSLSQDSITEFYLFAKEIKPRAYNPTFHFSILQMCEALLFELNPKEFSNHAILKMQSSYYLKSKVNFSLEKKEIICEGLKLLKKFRFNEKIDLFLIKNQSEKKNPFTELTLTQSPNDLQTKIIFKELREKIQNKKIDECEDGFIKEIAKDQIVVVEDLGEFWFHQDQIYSLTYM